MGPGKYENVEESESFLIMINPIVSPRTRMFQVACAAAPAYRRVLTDRSDYVCRSKRDGARRGSATNRKCQLWCGDRPGRHCTLLHGV
jgi:hypothetical protein